MLFTRASLILFCTVLVSCAGGKYGKVTLASAPKVINVSSYDPKERQRKGQSFSPLSQASLKANGAHGLIARCGKGYELDSKCADFLTGAERQNLKIGAYYFVKANISAKKQADKFIHRLRQIKASKGLKTKKILLVGDIDTKCTSTQIVTFIQRIEALTGVTPVIYLENSAPFIARLAASPESHKKIIRRAPYWLALYSNTNKQNPHIKTPADLTKAYDVWDNWAMWQYGGVFWERGRSSAKCYRNPGWYTPQYFGKMDRPMERNAFNGSLGEFNTFWKKHSWAW